MECTGRIQSGVQVSNSLTFFEEDSDAEGGVSYGQPELGSPAMAQTVPGVVQDPPPGLVAKGGPAWAGQLQELADLLDAQRTSVAMTEHGSFSNTVQNCPSVDWCPVLKDDNFLTVPRMPWETVPLQASLGPSVSASAPPWIGAGPDFFGGLSLCGDVGGASGLESLQISSAAPQLNAAAELKELKAKWQKFLSDESLGSSPITAAFLSNESSGTTASLID
eukprot:CAMPEP_0177225392 /NCGR_PEP_ID=MMETSP0367-20130122/39522_1 /TAXON_ID=447022 ORGANISM="Scrippsiella hangoei-like, Strain SHHI-4" /NCGR_SAMPLE_ID=MMETSP0367 /ASSEMBLY_ACC=CAM_ASM_000362 /LENGTH=220 /DNA_ID=CAMNT_0018675483 /DNA_START=8 /DNA_END=667 /DNA_ORIENTATION=-